MKADPTLPLQKQPFRERHGYALRRPYAVWPDHEWNLYGHRMQPLGSWDGGFALLDIGYIGLSLGGFALFALVVRSMERF